MAVDFSSWDKAIKWAKMDLAESDTAYDIGMDIGSLSYALEHSLRREIMSSVSPFSTKAAQIIASNINVDILGPTSSVIYISPHIVPSIYHDVGLYMNGANLIKLYNDGKNVKKNAVYWGPSSNNKIIPIGRYHGWSHGGAHFLENTAAKFEREHPQCMCFVTSY